MKCTQQIKSMKKRGYFYQICVFISLPALPPGTQAELSSAGITRGHSAIAFCYFAIHFGDLMCASALK